MSQEVQNKNDSKPIKKVTFSDEISNVVVFEDSGDSNSDSIFLEELFDNGINHEADRESIINSPLDNTGTVDTVSETESLKELISKTTCVSIVPKEPVLYTKVEFPSSFSHENHEIIARKNSRQLSSETPPEILSETPPEILSETLPETLSETLPETQPETPPETPSECNDLQLSAPKKHKRSLQSSKINELLKEKYPEAKSATELKSAAFDVWREVKSGENEENVQRKKPKKNKMITVQKMPSKDIYEKWKRSKARPNKLKFPDFGVKMYSKSPEQRTKEEKEEIEMAFQAWKKKKDEILRQQTAEKSQKESEKKFEVLMKKRERETYSEAAFSTWCTHKRLVSEKEKKKTLWFLQKEEEKREKGNEAQKAFDEWLRRKVYAPKSNKSKMTEDKPPWIPSGPM